MYYAGFATIKIRGRLMCPGINYPIFMSRISPLYETQEVRTGNPLDVYIQGIFAAEFAKFSISFLKSLSPGDEEE